VTREPPPRPIADTPDEVGFIKQGMVRWFNPKELAATAMRVALAGVFGAYADKRELQAALPQAEDLSYADRSELWVDYVADLGDGFASTMTMAYLLAEEKLDPGIQGGHSFPTQRGALLVMGGDQVYPTATMENYENRMQGPYRAALPYVDGDNPEMYAIPGNHDWYDGLTSFMRVFCQRKEIGGWLTRQSRSYFALELPHRWWLWGIDVQFDAYIDLSQLEYFKAIADERMRPGDSVILCTATPSWVKAVHKTPEAFANLDYLERKIIRPSGAQIRCYVAGDTHHYARHETADRATQLIISGGGGAYLAATHHVPETLTLPPTGSKVRTKSTPSQEYKVQAMYPTPARSRALSFGVFKLPFLNPSFVALWAGIALTYGWVALASLRGPQQTLEAVARGVTFTELLAGFLRSPVAVLLTAVMFSFMIGFTQSADWRKKYFLGGGHALAQLLVIIAVMRVLAGLLAPVDGWWFTIAYLAGLGGVGGMLGSWTLSAYLWIADHFRCNTNELFSAQRMEGYKNFVRMHIDESGRLTIYPIGVRRVTQNWELRPNGRPGDPWYQPASADMPKPHLIEPPIRLEPLAKP
jgi:hypothetical protein